MKNLLLVHLESLNLINYKLNSNLFPVLQEIMQKCLVFDQYYSTATSTLMVIGDLMYGGMTQYEECTSLDFIPSKYNISSSLFDDLKEMGYYTGIYVYPDGGDRESAEKRHLAGFCNQMELKMKYSDYISSFEKGMEHMPFALMACNYISNLSINQYVDISNYDMNTGYWEAGYCCMDRCCGDLLQLLKDRNIMENTVVVFYGDHGDDYWGHGMHSGLTHAIEPNNLLIHTPLFIWDGLKRDKPEHNGRLLQTSDLRSYIMKLLEGKSIDDLPQRSYVIARNEYAAQPVRPESFNKAYSITEGHYLLMASSAGLEMYDIQMDPACQNNLLRFFSYENGILKLKEESHKNFQYHFPGYLNSREQRILRQKFYELKHILKKEVLELYKVGGLNEAVMLTEMKFEIL